MKICQKCNSCFPDTANFCKRDGTPLVAMDKNKNDAGDTQNKAEEKKDDIAYRTCPRCSHQIVRGQLCMNCGLRLPS